jgi:hypothetical protein
VYLGYELLIEPQQPGEYLATFGKLGVTALELEANGAPKVTQGPGDAPGSSNLAWTMLQLPAMPEPRVVHDGDVITIDLFLDGATGERLADEIHINQPRPVPSFLPHAPTVSGIARDFSVTDAELQIIQPRVSLNSRAQISSGPAALRSVRGALIWLYFPDHGRFVLSLLPRPALGFKKAGEVRGGVLTFTLDGDTVKLECMTAIANGNAPYNLYVLRDEDWEPTSDSQKDWPGSGTVGVDELTALKQK